MTEKENLLSKAVLESSVRIDLKNKKYTTPRTFGVYEVESPGDSKKFRYGNHPVRETELINEFGNIKRCGLFLSRDDAKVLSNLLNS